jgi:2-dehydro-3-deoxygluconokinase
MCSVTFDLLTAGEAMAVASPDPPRPLREAAGLALGVAGAEANVAAYLARLGQSVAYVSRVGDDPFGELISSFLASSGVSCFLDVSPDFPTGVYFKDPSPSGTRVHYYRAGSAASTMDSSVWSSPWSARIVHLSGITPALSASCAAFVADGLRSRPVPGALYSFDVNYRPGLWPVTRAAVELAALANQADLVFVGLDEAATLWGVRTPGDVRAVLPKCATLVVKDGAVGATSFTDGGSFFLPAPPVEVVEPVGAGDAFAAGYLFGVLHAVREEDRLRLGHTLAAVALTTVGDVGAVPPASSLLAALPR